MQMTASNRKESTWFGWLAFCVNLVLGTTGWHVRGSTGLTVHNMQSLCVCWWWFGGCRGAQCCVNLLLVLLWLLLLW